MCAPLLGLRFLDLIGRPAQVPLPQVACIEAAIVQNVKPGKGLLAPRQVGDADFLLQYRSSSAGKICGSSI